MKIKIIALVVSALLCGIALSAQSSDISRIDSVKVKPGGLQMPLVFDRLQSVSDTISVPKMVMKAPGGSELTVERNWLTEEMQSRQHLSDTRYRTMIHFPDAVPYNVASLPEPPKEYVVKVDPSKNQLDVDTKEELPEEMDHMLLTPQEKRRNWLHTMNLSLHFTQAFISDNWYQGGENQVNVLGDVNWSFCLNQKFYPKYLFENVIKYKVGVMSTHSDTLRNYAFNEDVFQLSSKFGYKAIKNWYYSASLNFKTQFFDMYKSNTNTLKSSLLSPAELNIGLGMTYNYKDKAGIKTFSLSVAPFSYNMKYCRDIEKLDPVSFGIAEGEHFKHNFGSNMEMKWSWAFSPQISWSSRLYVFTNYEYVQGDWENTFDFSVTRHLSTRIFAHLRYDRSRPWVEKWKYWQLKEILSFGLTYRFSTN